MERDQQEDKTKKGRGRTNFRGIVHPLILDLVWSDRTLDG